MQFNICPSCQEGTQRMNADPSLSMVDAMQMKIEFDWNRFYDSWDEGGWFASISESTIDEGLRQLLREEKVKLRSVDDLLGAVFGP